MSSCPQGASPGVLKGKSADGRWERGNGTECVLDHELERAGPAPRLSTKGSSLHVRVGSNAVMLVNTPHDRSSPVDWRHMSEMLEASDGVYTELKDLIVWSKDNGNGHILSLPP